MNYRKFADYVMPFLEKYNTYTDKDKILAHYGLETLYILVTKMVIVTILSLFLGITKEMYIFLLFYGLLRFYASGMHLSSSLGCTIMSTVIFLGGTYLCIYTDMDLSYRVFLAGISICSFALFSPADTHKKPLIRINDRTKKKIYSSLICYIYLILLFIFKDTFMLNILTYSLFLEAIMITPYIYKIFKQPYNNYIAYGKYKRKED